MQEVKIPSIPGNSRFQDLVMWNASLSATTDLFLNRPLELEDDIILQHNVNLKISNGGKIITNGYQITFEGTVDSDNDEWIEASPDNPPIFKKRSEIRVDEFVRDTCDRNRIQCAINSASKSNHCDVKLQTGKHYILDGSIWLCHNETHNSGFLSYEEGGRFGQARIGFYGGAKVHSWEDWIYDGVTTENPPFNDTLLDFTNPIGDCIVMSLRNHVDLNKYALRSFYIKGICIKGNTTGWLINFDTPVEGVKVENLSLWQQHIDGHGIQIVDTWSTIWKHIYCYGDRDRRDKPTEEKNTGTGLRVYNANPSYISGGQVTFEHVTIDGWKYATVWGESDLPGLPASITTYAGLLGQINIINCLFQQAEIGMYVGDSIYQMYINAYIENCTDIGIWLDKACQNISLVNTYFNMYRTEGAGLQIGPKTVQSAYFSTAYDVSLLNCRFRGITNGVTAIKRRSGGYTRASSYSEIGSFFSLLTTTPPSEGRARDFREVDDSTTYQYSSFITGDTKAGEGTWLDDLGLRYINLKINAHDITFGRMTKYSESRANIVNDVLIHDNKGNMITVANDGDLKKILEAERGMELLLTASHVNGFTLKHSALSDDTGNIRTNTGYDKFIPYTRSVKLSYVYAGYTSQDVYKWVEAGVETISTAISEIQYVTIPASGEIDWDEESLVVGVDGTADINSITGFYGGRKVTLFGRATGGITIKNYGTGTYKILTKTGADTILAYHKIMTFISINDGSFKYWMEV